MASYQINFDKLCENVRDTFMSDHLKTRDKTIEETLSVHIDMNFLQIKLIRIHKNSMIRDYLYKQLNYFVTHDEFQSLVSNLGKIHGYVEECIQGMIRVNQKKIYNLYEFFDNDSFRDDEMIENKGEWREYYYDRPYSDVNSWRVTIDKEVEKNRLVFMEKMEEMENNANKMRREEFILYPSYSDFFGETTKKKANMNLARDAQPKKRKQPP